MSTTTKQLHLDWRWAPTVFTEPDELDEFALGMQMQVHTKINGSGYATRWEETRSPPSDDGSLELQTSNITMDNGSTGYVVLVKNGSVSTTEDEHGHPAYVDLASHLFTSFTSTESVIVIDPIPWRVSIPQHA